jgi:quercetin dioxygenase-like cupin family protein
MNVRTVGPDPAEVFVDLPVHAGAHVRMGLVRFQAGARVPSSGESLHEQAEHSYVLSGELAVTSGGTTVTARVGDLISIPSGESHFTQVLSDASVVYLLVG